MRLTYTGSCNSENVVRIYVKRTGMDKFSEVGIELPSFTSNKITALIQIRILKIRDSLINLILASLQRMFFYNNVTPLSIIFFSSLYSSLYLTPSFHLFFSYIFLYLLVPQHSNINLAFIFVFC